MRQLLIQIGAALIFAIAMVWDKYNLRRFRFDPKTYTNLVFIYLTIFAGLVSSFTFRVDWPLLTVNIKLAAVGLVGMAFLWNKLYYYFQSKETLQDFEVMNLVVPAVTALLAAAVFPAERHVVVYLAVAISLGALYLSRLGVHHTRYNNYSRLVGVLILAMATEAVLRKVVLVAVDPATLYFGRTAVVTVLLYIFYRPTSWPKEKIAWFSALVPACLGATAMILMFYGYSQLGLVMTTLVFGLSPMFVYFMDSLVLREKIHPKNIWATIVIVAAIILATIYG